MTFQQSIHDALVEGLSPSAIEVINESHMHSVPKDAQTHFKVVIVSDAFAAKSPVERHRMVNALLGAEWKAGLHALSIHAYTPGQWRDRGGSFPESPPCMGGSKATSK